MERLLKRLTDQIIPFLLLGILIVLVVIGIVVFSWILIVGAITGLVLYAIAWLRHKLFPSRHKNLQTGTEHRGRTFDNENQ